MQNLHPRLFRQVLGIETDSIESSCCPCKTCCAFASCQKRCGCFTCSYSTTHEIYLVILRQLSNLPYAQPVECFMNVCHSAALAGLRPLWVKHWYVRSMQPVSVVLCYKCWKYVVCTASGRLPAPYCKGVYPWHSLLHRLIESTAVHACTGH